jgi:hypothetical protein
MDPEQTITIIIMVSVFGLVFSIWCICVFLWLGQSLSRLKLVQKRLGIVKKETDESQTLRLWREKKQESAKVASQEKATLQERLESLRIMTGWRRPAHVVIMGVAGVSITGLLITYISSRCTGVGCLRCNCCCILAICTGQYFQILSFA